MYDSKHSLAVLPFTTTARLRKLKTSHSVALRREENLPMDLEEPTTADWIYRFDRSGDVTMDIGLSFSADQNYR